MFTGPDNRPTLMGILNVTPDSFSDGGKYTSPDVAVAHARTMVEEGADIIDIGGESTRPGSSPVAVDEQIARVVPVIRLLISDERFTGRISIDTASSEVAEAALDAGARIVNDTSGGLDKGLVESAARHNAAVIFMHMQGTPKTMQDDPSYDDVVTEVRDALLARADRALNLGLPRSHIALDPGIGFGKKRRHNLELIAGLRQFVETGFPIVVGASRKRFMGAICEETVPAELIGATCATTALGVDAGVQVFRVHDVKANRQAADVAWALKTTRE